MAVCFEHGNDLSGTYNVQNFLITDVTIGLLRRALVHAVSKLFWIEYCRESHDWTVIEFIKVFYVDKIFWAKTIVFMQCAWWNNLNSLIILTGFMTSVELEMYQSVPSVEFNTYWIPCTWFINLLKETKKGNRITDSHGLQIIMQVFCLYLMLCSFVIHSLS